MLIYIAWLLLLIFFGFWLCILMASLTRVIRRNRERMQNLEAKRRERDHDNHVTH